MVSKQDVKGTTVRIPPDLLERLDTFCKKQHQTRSEVIRMSLEEHMDHVETPEKFVSSDMEEAISAVMFRLTRNDEGYRKEIRQVLGESLMGESDKNSSLKRF